MMNNELQKRIFSSVILIAISIFFIVQGSIFFTFFLSILFLATCNEWFGLSKKNNLLKVFGIIFLLFSFYSAFYIREESLKYFLFILIICILTDIGGYVFGKTLNGPKLIKISPKKTYAGVIGSFLFSLIGGLTYLSYLNIDLIIYDTISLNVFFLISFISLISQIGDLIISYFKRKAKLKDTGKILPGHGGLLDRIDGLIFVIPSIYILMLVLK